MLLGKLQFNKTYIRQFKQLDAIHYISQNYGIYINLEHSFHIPIDIGDFVHHIKGRPDTSLDTNDYFIECLEDAEGSPMWKVYAMTEVQSVSKEIPVLNNGLRLISNQ